MSAQTLNQRWAARVVGNLVAAGVRHAVVAPGSRSTPLALAFAERAQVRTWSVLDERSAAFFALGLAKASGAPSAVLATSGTAGAHFLPAVMEASAGATPLVVLTADRPWELHGFGAPQTAEQDSLFGRFARAVELLPTPEGSPEVLAHLDAVLARAGALASARRGPVHLNVPFREPLVHPDGLVGEPVTPTAAHFVAARAVAEVGAVVRALEVARRPLIVCGPRERDDGFAAAVHRLGARLGAPVIAELASNARLGTGAIWSADLLLRNQRFAAAMRPDVVLRFGGGLTSKAVQGWLDSSGAQLFVFPEGRGPVDASHRAQAFLEGDAVAACDAVPAVGAPRPEYLARFLAAQRLAEAQLAAEPAALHEPAAARELVAALPPGAALFLSSSMPIRDAEAFAAHGPALRVYSNRGLNGIDGVTSTALGVAAASARPTALLVGDLALLHDLSGLLIARRHQLPLTIVAVNNDGGGIFHFLPVAERTAHFEALFGTPHGVDLAQVAGLAQARLHRPADLPSYRRALAAALEGGLHLIEVRTERRANAAEHRALFARVDRALEALP